MQKHRFLFVSTGLFLLEWVVLAFHVYSRADWLLENLLVFIFFGPAIWLFVKGHLSKTSYLSILVFLAFHSVGAHFTYSLVPYEDWFRSIFGVSIQSSFGFERNHYDRFVHFLWGLLLFLPFKETIRSVVGIKGLALSVYALFSIIVGSTLYETVEWLAALVFGGDLGVAYLGTQGDVWDAQKDQVLALLGAVLALFIFRERKK